MLQANQRIFSQSHNFDKRNQGLEETKKNKNGTINRSSQSTEATFNQTNF
jgi:hypothetical protein